MTLKVYEHPCDQCLFSKNKIVSDERKDEIIESVLKDDGFFVCHKSTLRKETVCCRAFYDRYRLDTRRLRLAQILKGVEFVPLPIEEKKEEE